MESLKPPENFIVRVGDHEKVLRLQEFHSSDDEHGPIRFRAEVPVSDTDAPVIFYGVTARDALEQACDYLSRHR